MRATLEFDLPEERSEHLAAVHAGMLLSAMEETDQLLRGYLKHGVPDLVEATKVMEQARSILGEAAALVSEG